MVEVLNTVILALQGSIGLFFQVIDGLDARDFLFGALCTAVVYRLLLVPVLGGRADFSRRETGHPGSKFNSKPSLNDDDYFDYLMKGH